MTTTCTRRALLSALSVLTFLPTPGRAQGLEERVYQNRRLQSESSPSMEAQMRDSLLRERAGRRAKSSTSGLPGGFENRRDVVDSMISGPSALDLRLTRDSLDLDPMDGLRAGQDTTRPGGRRGSASLRRYEQIIFQSLNRSAFSSSRSSSGRGYVLGPGDQIAAFLWGDREKEQVLTLNSEGKAFVEGVGMVPLAGLTLDEAEQRLKERLGRIHSGVGRGTTHFALSLEASGPIKVFVLGEVQVPGGYVFSGNTSVLSALYFARGPTDIGSVRNLQLSRGGKKFTLDLYQYLMKGELPTPSALQDGDILFAPRAEILAGVEGDVGRNAVFELKRGEGVKELLEFAGRANPTAAHQRMGLQRIFPGGEVRHLDLEAPQEYQSGKAKHDVQDGDKLLVRRSTEPGANFINVSGPVKYPGAYSADGVRNVRDLVAKAGGLREDAFLGRVHIVRYWPDGSSSLKAYSLDTAMADTISLVQRDDVILYSTREMYLPDSVEVAGAVFLPGRYEFRRGMSAKDLVMLAGGYLPNHQVGNLLVFRGGTRDDKVKQVSLKVQEGLEKSRDNFLLEPRDFVHVPVDPRWYKKEIVTLEGLFTQPGKYALLHPGERLASVIERVGGFKPSAYIEGGRFFRVKDSVGRVGVDIRRALGSPRSKANIALADGDSIYIPARLTTVKVLGEVGFETSVLLNEGAPVQYYIEKAGGFTRRSEKDRVVVQYANGETSRDGYFNRKPDAGSVIFVPQGPEPKVIDYFAGINAILGTLGVVVALTLSIQAISKD